MRETEITPGASVSDSEEVTHYHVLARAWAPGAAEDDFSEGELATGYDAEDACDLAKLDIERLVALFNVQREDGEDRAVCVTIVEPNGAPVEGQDYCRYRAVQPVNGSIIENAVRPCSGEMVSARELLAEMILGHVLNQTLNDDDEAILH